MALLVKCVLLSLSAVLLSLGFGGVAPCGAFAMGLPPPPPTVNFSIGVQGVVWCKSCRYRGYFPPMDASPLPGAVVYLRCRHGRRAASFRGVSGPGGYFLIQMSQQVAAFTSQECRVYVPRSPVLACSVPAYPSGNKGLPLKFQEFVKRGNALQGLYSVGNRLFRPKYPNKCY
ncbi:non-classical arabinogalactan protein 31-like [Phragmites australis]|uniref:non-classical arabinogalactan protein 31-like n=1 Tax=Phragmites australis TaxID=29695 RepID=UPI002D76E164|nr:non-classical arabinogalactan protein 31-like [Phragmites australis]